MIDTGGGVLIATICNTIGEASPYALWIWDGYRAYVADLTAHVRDASGLTGIAYRDGRVYVAVQANETRVVVLDLALNVVDVIASDSMHDLDTGASEVAADLGRPEMAGSTVWPTRGPCWTDWETHTP